MKLRALIVDDERLARAALRNLLDQRSDMDVVGEADGLATAKRAIVALTPDVVFLDVQMTDGTGFDLFDQIDVSCAVVFVTAYDSFALRAFEVNARDYLVKPVSAQDLDRAIGRLRSPEVTKPHVPSQLELDDVVCLSEGNRIRFTPVRDIVYITAADDYTEVHLLSGQAALVQTILREWELRLPARRFVRLHRSHLVNLGFVEEVGSDGGTWYARLRGAVTLPMSRRYAQLLRSRLSVGGHADK